MCTVLSSLFSNDNTNSLFTPWKIGSIKRSKYGFSVFIVTFGSYLLQSIVPLKPDFNCSSQFYIITTET